MKRFYTFGILALLAFTFTACERERTYYFLEAIQLNELPNFSQDANESGNEALPDVYLEITDWNDNVVWRSNYLLNVEANELPITYVMDNVIELSNDEYYLSVYDFDQPNQGLDEHLGTVPFPGRSNTSTYLSQYNDQFLSGTLSVTMDMLVERY